MVQTQQPRRRALGERCQRIVALCERPGGASAREAAQAVLIDPKSASAYLSQLVAGRRVQRVVLPGTATRYFVHQQHADAYRQAPRPPKVNWALNLPGTPKHLHQQVREQALLRMPPRPAGDAPAVTEGRGYTHDPRYQVGPDEPVFGAGFAAVGIGRDVRTGRPW